MEQAQRRLLVSRIISGNLRYQNRLIFVPAFDYEAECIYGELLTDAIFQGCLTNEQLVDTPILFDKEIKSILDKISDQKVKLYHARNNLIDQKKIRAEIESLREKVALLHNMQYKYFNYSAEYVAEFGRLSFLVEKFNGPDINMSDFFIFYNQNTIEEEEIREIAQSDAWLEVYNSKVYSFKQTKEQIALINWTERYQNIAQHPERPEDFVIQDHDMLDGWMIYLSRKRSRPERKVKDGQEVYIPVPPDQVAEVYAMNSPEAKIIMKRRENLIKKKGSVNELDLPDVKEKIQMEMNRR